MIETKMVPFMDTQLIAVKDNDGQIWVGVRSICKDIGLSKKQCDHQVANIHINNILSKASSFFELPTNGGNQRSLCLKLEHVPLWLAKISVTPAMRRKTPEIAERLVQYQLKAKDVLAAAFLNKEPPLTVDSILANPDFGIRLLTELKETRNKVSARYDSTSELVAIQTCDVHMTGH